MSAALRAGAAPDPRRQAATRAALLFAVAGALAIVQSLPLMPAPDALRYQALGALDAAIALLLARLPWHRWPARALVAVVPLALAVAVLFALVGRGLPVEVVFAFHLVIAVWAGLSLPRWTVLKCAPLFLLAQLIPHLPRGDWAQAANAAVTVTVMVTLVGEVVAHVVARLEQARAESEQRARILRAVLLATQGFNTLRSDEVMAHVVSCVRDLGFDAAALSIIDARRGLYRLAYVSGFPPDYRDDVHPLDRGITGLVWREARTTVVENYRAHPAAVPALRESGFDYLVATPVRVQGEVRAVLFGARRQPQPLNGEMRDAFELLASHAGVALHNAQEFEAEAERSRQLQESASRDDLTGLGNRRHVEALLAGLRAGDALLMLDLDHFKRVNDTDGHAAGDRLLRELGDFLREAVRGSDAAARYGGEEFVVVARDGGPSADLVAARLLAGWRDRHPRTTMSIGWAVHRAGESGRQTLERADAALYRSKRAGRDRASGESELQEA